jgi:DNA-binding PadR family transcriptional regulator
LKAVGSKDEALCAGRRGVPTGLLIHYILHKLASKPAYGYELLSDIERKTQGLWRPSPGSLYPLFKRMLDKGLIDVKEVKVGRRSRRLYTITSKGLNFLKDAKAHFLNASHRLAASRGLLLGILDLEDIPKFVLEGSKLHLNLLHAVIEDSWGKLSKESLRRILEEYESNLVDELGWVRQRIKQVEEEKEEVESVA